MGLVVIGAPIVGFGVARRRKHFGGRDEMRRFFDALRAQQLPTLDSPDEVVRWNRLIISERNNRRGEFVTGWLNLAVGVLIVLVIVLNALKGLPFEFSWLFFATIWFVGFAKAHLTARRALESLTALADQGTTRGYGYSLPAH
ncbi:hypothetical protein ACFXHA_25040 [Nocardia sp. NPDC059240]|uniref:hypothetical protein n=1 Tax=Nocardia sp. NPDC059240 TaxID=3346786 RepID=UPI0036A23D30